MIGKSMSQSRAVFFDIDGTLWDRSNFIPQSTRDAVSLLRANGHKAFICTGRTRGYVTSEKLLSIGFDGIVSGLGTMIEYEGNIGFLHEIDNGILARALEIIRKYQMKPILEGKDFLYMEEEDFRDDDYGRKVMTELGDRRRSIEGTRGSWAVSKFSCSTLPVDNSACWEELSDDFDVIIHSSEVAELAPRGFSKGYGLQQACRIAGIPVEASIAIGDSANDLDMFRAAGFSVAMGNGSEIARASADYVTTTLHEDGIRNALCHLGLI